MPDKPPTMRVQYKKVEKQERSRLEAILMDPAKTEADREFARERLQAIREAAVARAKIRAARRADYVEPKPAEENAKEDAVVEDDYPPTKPTLEDCYGDEKMLRDEMELWQIELSDRAAHRVLDSPKSSLIHRQNAERTLRKSAQRRHEIYPTIYGLDGERVSASTTSPATDPADPFSGRHKPFKSRHAKGTSAHAQEKARWLEMNRLADEEERTKFRRENPEEYERQLQARYAAERKRLSGVISIDHHGHTFDGYGHRIGSRAKPSSPTNDDGSLMASPLQKKVWGEQSREFARLRGEIVDPPTPPAVEIRDRTTAYRLTLDGFFFWGDNTPCEIPLPAGTRIVSAPTPPLYHSNDRSIPPGLKFDPIAFVWTTIQ
jgi:hypothetical protein